MAEHNSRMVTVTDRAAKDGDVAVIDYTGAVDGVEFEGGKAENYELTLGSNTFIPGFEVSEFDTIAELKADIKAKKEKQNEERSKAELEEKAVRAVAESSEVEIPNGMVELELDNMQEDMNRRLSYQGISFEQYLQMLGKTVADFRKESVEPAKDSIKMRLVLEAVYTDAKIEVSDEEVEAKLKELAQSYGRKEEELKNNEDLINSIKVNIKSEKGIALIVDNAKIKVVEPKEEKEEKTEKKTTAKKSTKKTAEKEEKEEKTEKKTTKKSTKK